MVDVTVGCAATVSRSSGCLRSSMGVTSLKT
jgi:hypothetical protein